MRSSPQDSTHTSPASLPSARRRQGAQGALPTAANVLHGAQEELGPWAVTAL